jgi:PAS domain S-box-containing protein
VRKDNTLFWCRITVAALNRSDPTHGVVGIYEDVSEAHHAADALRQALGRQEAIFAASPFGIATFEQRRFALTSPALERMFGYAPGELTGKLTRVIYASDEKYEDVGRDLYGSLRSGAPLHVQETELVRKDGSRFWGRITAAALERGDPMAGLIAMYEDITDRKAADAALKESNEQLEARTLELAEREAYFRTIFENSGSGIVSRPRTRARSAPTSAISISLATRWRS